MQQQDLGQFPYREFIWGIGGTARYAKIAGHTSPNFYVDSTHPNAHAKMTARTQKRRSRWSSQRLIVRSWWHAARSLSPGRSLKP